MASCRQKAEDLEDWPEDTPNDSVVIQYEGSKANMCPDQQVFVFSQAQ